MKYGYKVILKDTELYHYGRSKKDGAPGVGTGNWRRSGHKVFVSGTYKTQNDSRDNFYRPTLNPQIKKELNRHINNGDEILVGDAPGIDSQVQDYLKEKDYRNVTVYYTGDKPRYMAQNWEQKSVSPGEYKEGTKEWLAAKDKAMTDDADEGLAITDLPGSIDTRANIERLMEQNKDVKVFEIKPAFKYLDKLFPKNDGWIDENALESLRYMTKFMKENSKETDKKKKAQAEVELLKKITAKDASELDYQNYSYLFGKIAEKSVYWYESEPVSDGQKAIYDEYNAKMNSSKIIELNTRVSNAEAKYQEMRRKSYYEGSTDYDAITKAKNELFDCRNELYKYTGQYRNERDKKVVKQAAIDIGFEPTDEVIEQLKWVVFAE